MIPIFQTMLLPGSMIVVPVNVVRAAGRQFPSLLTVRKGSKFMPDFFVHKI